MNALRPLLRELAAEALERLHLTDPARVLRDRLTIVTFHRVLPEERRANYPLPGLVVTPDELHWYLDFVKRRFRCGSLREIARGWRAHDGDARPPLAVTFDDGQLDNFEYARPVLAAHHIHASFYVPVEAVERKEPLFHDRFGFAAQALLRRRGREALIGLLSIAEPAADERELCAQAIRTTKGFDPERRRAALCRLEREVGGPCVPDWAGLMDFAQIKTLADEGHEIGSHSMTHALMPQCSDDELEREIGGSRAELERRLDGPVTSFCYPNGDYDRRAIDVVRRAGYEYAVTTRWGTNPSAAEPFDLLRCDMDSRRVRSHGGSLSASLLSMRLAGFGVGLR